MTIVYVLVFVACNLLTGDCRNFTVETYPTLVECADSLAAKSRDVKDFDKSYRYSLGCQSLVTS